MNVNEVWDKLETIKRLADEVNEAEYILYGVGEAVDKAKEKLVSIAVSQVLNRHGIRNLTVPDDVYRRLNGDGFSMARVEEALKPLIEKADDVALEQLLRKASHLLPPVWDKNGVRPPRVDEIVKGRKLHLRVYWSYGSVSFSSLEYIMALDKVIPALIGRKPASKVKPMGIYNLILNFGNSLIDYSQARQYVLDNRYIEGFRIYKNGKFVITFKKERNARVVAKALINAS